MQNETIGVSGVDKQDVYQTVVDIIKDVYPRREIYRTRVNNIMRVGIQGSRQKVEVSDSTDGTGDVIIEMHLTNDTAISRITREFKNGMPGQSMKSGGDKTEQVPLSDVARKSDNGGSRSRRQQTNQRQPRSPDRPQSNGGQMGSVHKPFDHDEADYRSPGAMDFNDEHSKCKDCAHYDNNGNCRIVPDIEPNGYCSEFYADFGVYGHDHGPEEGTEINLKLWGDGFDWDRRSANDFVQKVKKAIEDRMEEMF